MRRLASILLAGLGLVVITVIVVSMTARRPVRHTHQEERSDRHLDGEIRAIKRLRELGGIVKLDKSQPGFAVIEVNLQNAGVSDAELKELVNFKDIHTVDLRGTRVTDAGLKELAGLKSLRTLDLSGTRVTDAGLKELAQLNNLCILNLRYTGVTGEGLQELAGLKNLRTLDLSGTRLTGVDLGELANLKRRLHLDIDRLIVKQLTDQALKALRELNLLHVLCQAKAEGGELPRNKDQIVTLDLCDTHVTDAGLKELAGLKNLQMLYLGGTGVTDIGLKELANLKNLHTLELSYSRVTDVGVRELRKALPRCTIVREK